MFDTMTLTKITGAFCGALLVFLLGKYAAETVYKASVPHGDHGEEVVQGYIIDTGAEEEVVEEGVPIEVILAAGEASKGERVFNKCRACHLLDAGENGVGPYLYGVVGREKGAAVDYAYTAALGDLEGAWSPENIYAFLENPGAYAPGTAMSYALKNSAERADVIAYLDSLDD
ncbi:c-type cytochrome [Roseovarius sp. LXJ103]|uniref:c-type cytochrome n=1 Tax=Roseovarius carneus TaxID=2853164 RepID=UPI000D615EA6|nr:c-type cytochrome [Roseovarius carneus]MBZ8117360.1 c-type cytochrome [Roseovarius carneus]PWE36822.1 cytochrome c family protein [Pelagicola sp. LXJ1103]